MKQFLIKYFETEKRKALLPFLLVEIMKMVLGYMLNNKLSQSKADSIFLFSNIIFLFLHYSLDIIIAKDVHDPINWYIGSFKTNAIFFKYVVSYTISYITSETITEYINRLFIRHNFMITKKSENNVIIIRTVVNLILNLLIFYHLKFKWALSVSKNVTIDIIVMFWTSILIILYMIFKSINNLEKKICDKNDTI
jgi:hypothetical protein|uniref:Uncharacterized protein n=1 Tax=viral metagenome TaxID=1070528 RepID=A0A6C0BP83_9ZZZZ